jgi:hypothetical protein
MQNIDFYKFVKNKILKKKTFIFLNDLQRLNLPVIMSSLSMISSINI